MTTYTHNTKGPKPPAARADRRSPGRMARAGMTLVEMLVAISVMAVMILAVSSILVQTQRFISAAQENRRSHAMAFTIARVIRRDLSRASKDGFLSITSGGSGNGLLVFSTAGPISGVNDPIKGDGSIICYGQQTCDDGTNPGQDAIYLWRPEFICDCQTGSPSTAFTGERINVNFSTLRRCAGTRSDANSPFTLQSLVNAAAGNSPSSGFQLPPQNATHLEDLWQVLVVGISDFEVKWTDGTKDTNGLLNWYGGPKLWTHENQSDWPKAIKITFKIKNLSLADGTRGNSAKGVDYEVISTIGE